MSNSVLIHGLKLPVRVGCDAGERDSTQTVEFHVTIGVCKTKHLTTGDPKDTVCYRTVCDHLKEMTSSGEWPLLEQLAEDAAERIFDQFAAADEILIELRKFVVPESDWVGIKIGRTRNKSGFGFS